jgi:hypothetical protein
MKLNVHRHLLLLVTIWVAVQGLFLFSHGIIATGEAEKYIGEAHTFLATGTLSVTNYWFYFTQIFALALSFKTGLGFTGVLIIQLFFNAWATWSFYRLAMQFFPQQTALTGTILLLLNHPFQELNTYLQTESLFFSFTIIFGSWLLRLSRCTLLNVITAMLSLGLLSITRPTGLLLVPPTALYLFFRFFSTIDQRFKIAITAAVTILFIFIVNAAIGSKGEWNFILPYQQEQIICGLSRIEHTTAHINSNEDSLYGLLYYITHHLGLFLKLAILKSVAFFGLLRSYYSTGHNFILAFFFYPIYMAFIISLKWWLKNEKYRLLFLAGAIGLTWTTTILTCDDWHNRWLLSVSPWIILMALPAISKLLALVFPNRQKQ